MALSDLVTGANLGPEFQIGTNVSGQITINVDGTTVVRDGATGQLSAAQGAISYDGATYTLTYTDAAGATQTADLSALANAADIFVTGATLVGTTLTLTDNDTGTPDVIIDLASITGVSADAGNLLDAGTDGLPLLTVATLQADLAPACKDVFGNDLFFAVPA